MTTPKSEFERELEEAYKAEREKGMCCACESDFEAGARWAIGWDKAFQEKLKENDQLRDLLQEMRDALENLAAERCEGKTPCRVQYAHDLVDKADQKLKRLRGE